MKTRHPIQPLEKDDQDVLRFKENTLVRALLEHGQKTGFGLNELASEFNADVYADDRRQLAQLIGYSLSGYGDLSYVDDYTYGVAAAMAEAELDEKGALRSDRAMMETVLRGIVQTTKQNIRDRIERVAQGRNQ